MALLRWEFAGQQPGKLERFLPDSIEGEAVVQVLPLPSQGSLGLLSSDGRFKRLPIEEFQELSGRATTVLKLKEGVTLQRVVAGQEGDTLVVATSTGRVLRLSLDETQLPLMGRAAQGPLLMRLLPGEQLVGAACLAAEEAETTGANQSAVVLATANGQLKRLLVSSLRPCQRGDMGQIGLRLQERGDYLVDLQSPTGAAVGSTVLGLLTDKGWSCRIDLNELEGEDTSGTGINLKLPQGQQIQELIPLIN